MIGAALLAACQTTEPAPTPQPYPVAQPDSQLPTEVQLQASFAVPGMLDGQPTIHTELRYLLYLPRGYDQAPETRWPVILFLHGSGDDDYDSAFVLSYGLPAVLQAGEQPEEFPFIVISPQAFPGGTWWTEDALPILDALLGEVLETYRADPDRVYLTGLSMGGYGSWYLATTYPERFAAMVSVSGSGYQSPVLAGADTLCRMQDMAVWAIHGAQDQISDPEASRLNALALKASCLSEVVWTLYEDEGHIGTYERAYRDPQLYQWLLEHHR